MRFRNSRCRGSWLHRFGVVGQSEHGVLERCDICHKKVSHRIVNGTINNTKYLSYHLRSGLQPEHRLFAHEYPERRMNRAQRRAI